MGLFAKVASGLTEFSPSDVVYSSCCNWSSIMAPYFLVPLEDSIGKGILVLDLYSHSKPKELNNNPGWN